MNLGKILKTYFVIVSILTHCIFILVLLYFVVVHVTENWRWSLLSHWLAGNIDKTEVFPINRSDQFNTLPVGQWVKIHQQKYGDSIRFSRQSTAGCSYDSKNGRMFVFGSDIYGKNWDNTVHVFDISYLQWQDEYVSDSVETYNIKAKGYITAGNENNRPAAMQVYGAMAYDEVNERLIIASSMKRDGYGQYLEHLWVGATKNPAWVYDFSLKKWVAYPDQQVDFSPYKIVYDSLHRNIVGFNPNGIFEWSQDQFSWKKTGNKTYQAWNTNAVYDSVNNVFLLYGGSNMTNDIHVYRSGEKSTEVMPTPGIRPPTGQSIPLAFHRALGKMVALIDVGEIAQTWFYDYRQDGWQRLDNANFPYKVGMNYCMEYDSKNNLLVFVSSPPMEETAVWALRL